MAANKYEPFTNKEKGELEKRLEQLPKEKRVLFAARCALRVFSLLALKASNESYFDYWEGNKRSEYIISIWRANLVTFWYNNGSARASASASAEASARAFASRAFGVEAYAAEAASASAEAASASVYAAEAYADPDSAAYAADSSARAFGESKFNLWVPNAKKAIWRDLELLDETFSGSSKQSPLWEETHSEFNNWLKKEMQAAFQQAAKEERETESKGAFHILENIWPIYWGIYNGNANEKDIENTLVQIEDFFEGKTVEPIVLSSQAPLNESSEEPSTEPLIESLTESKDSPSTSNTAETNTTRIESIAGHRHSNHQAAQEDTLNRQHLVATLGKLLANEKNDHHQTIGLLGHWGIGKSTVIELLKTSLTNSQKDIETEFLFADFNAWEYEHTDNLQAGIAQEMIKALSSAEPQPHCWEQASWSLIRRPCLTMKFAMSIHGYKFLIPLFLFAFALIPFWTPEPIKNAFTNFFNIKDTGITSGLPYAWLVGFLYPALKNTKALFAGPMAKELLTYLKLPNYGEHLGTIPVMREHMKKLTKARLKKNQRLLYVVDDLDRCGHEGIVKVMEAVRMVLDLDKVIVVIAVDQRIALAALALHYKDLATQHHIKDPRLIARDYLSKIIHLPIVLTEPDDASISGYLQKMWDDTSSAPQGTEKPKDINESEITDNFEIINRLENHNEAEASNESEIAHSLENNALESNDEAETSTESEIAHSLEDNALEDNTETKISQSKIVEQLTPEQKAAFLYWVKHFHLSNPRQLKRLNNSFNFLRNFYEKPVEEIPEKIIEDKELSKSEGAEHAFPMMVTLFALEHLNNIDDLAIRSSLKQLLKGKTTNEEVLEKHKKINEKALIEHKITPLVIKLAALSLSNNNMIKGIEPFVLPAVE